MSISQSPCVADSMKAEVTFPLTGSSSLSIHDRLVGKTAATAVPYTELLNHTPQCSCHSDARRKASKEASHRTRQVTRSCTELRTLTRKIQAKRDVANEIQQAEASKTP